MRGIGIRIHPPKLFGSGGLAQRAWRYFADPPLRLLGFLVNEAVRRQIWELEHELEKTKNRAIAAEAAATTLAEVAKRDLARVKAETAIIVRREVDAKESPLPVAAQQMLRGLE